LKYNITVYVSVSNGILILQKPEMLKFVYSFFDVLYFIVFDYLEFIY